MVHAVRQSDQSSSSYDFAGVMNDLYSGVTRSELTCQSCSKSSCKYEPFVDISLSIDFLGEAGSSGLEGTAANAAGAPVKQGKGKLQLGLHAVSLHPCFPPPARPGLPVLVLF